MWNWFKSATVRRATEMSNQARRLLRAQEDLLTPESQAAVEKGINELNQALKGRAPKETLSKKMEELGKVADKHLKRYPNPALRENIEVILVAIAVAMGVRTFFLQPFKIPTGSMQPTLYGITPPANSGNEPDLKLPGRVPRFFQFWRTGVSYYHEVAPGEGQITEVEPPKKFLLFNLKQRYRFNDQWRTIWFPAEGLFERAAILRQGYDGRVSISPKIYQSGEDILRLRVWSGDHLFVDRLTYNFRRPKRGEIVVFETRGIPGLPQDQFYIKRLVGLPGETLEVGSDRHLRVNGERLTAATPRFENVYGFTNAQPRESEYSGHVPAGVFAEGDGKFSVGANRYFVMGDNTLNSLDSRSWGDLSRTNVIGKSYFVYWPFTSRFGWSVR